MDSISLLELKDLIFNRSSLLLYEDLYKVIHYDTTKAAETFAKIVKNAKLKYEMKRPLSLTKRVYVDENPYEFVDNFDSYISGGISLNNIELIPKSIDSVRSCGFVSAKYWKYDRPYFYNYTGQTTVSLSYSTRYPMKWQVAEDNELTSDSKIYYLNIDDEIFLNFTEYFVLKHIRDLNNSINMNLPIDILSSVSDKITELEKLIEDANMYNVRLSRLWSK